MKIKNLYLGLKQLLSLRRLFTLLFISGNGWGLFSIHSHINSSTGKPKIKYNTQESAKKAAINMNEKYGYPFSAYKCIYCDGYHIGKDRY